jgi:hypothetical protein
MRSAWNAFELESRYTVLTVSRINVAPSCLEPSPIAGSVCHFALSVGDLSDWLVLEMLLEAGKVSEILKYPFL